MFKSFREDNVLVRSNRLGEKELEPTKQRVMQWCNEGRTSMEIMFRLAESKHTVSQTYEGGCTVLTID